MTNPVVRNVLAAIGGYVAMFAVAFALLSLTWAVLGADGSFQAGTWEVSTAWIVVSFVLGLIVSMAGGFCASKLGADEKAVWILAGLVIVMGVLQALPETGHELVRPDGVSMFEAMGSIIQPRWLYYVNPILGVIGVLLGARFDKGNAA
jgi:hypothetical protein